MCWEGGELRLWDPAGQRYLTTDLEERAALREEQAARQAERAALREEQAARQAERAALREEQAARQAAEARVRELEEELRRHTSS